MPSKAELIRLLTVAVEQGIRKKDPFCVQHKAGLTNLLKLFEQPFKQPNKEWLILLLSKVPGPKAPLFQKGYVPPKEKTELRLKDVKHFDNSDGFWDGLEKVSQWIHFTQVFEWIHLTVLAQRLPAKKAQ